VWYRMGKRPEASQAYQYAVDRLSGRPAPSPRTKTRPPNVATVPPPLKDVPLEEVLPVPDLPLERGPRRELDDQWDDDPPPRARGAAGPNQGGADRVSYPAIVFLLSCLFCVCTVLLIALFIWATRR
jgi:hypothetical protein